MKEKWYNYCKCGHTDTLHSPIDGCLSNRHGFFTWIAHGFDFPPCKCEKYEFDYMKIERKN